VFLPLILGGAVRPVRPIGARASVALAGHTPRLNVEIGASLGRARVQAVRRLLPLDELPEPSAGEWLLLFALNDLLQVTNPALTERLGADRPLRLLDMVEQVIHCAGAPATLADSVVRHAGLYRLFELTRNDVEVSWWVGRAVFHGQPVPRRLLAWPTTRRVSSRAERVRLDSMAVGQRWSERWAQVLAQLIAASPLTDLACAGRESPSFRWTGASLALLRVPLGQRLALRALQVSGHVTRAASILRRAGEEVHRSCPPAAAVVNEFAAHVDELNRRMAPG
jgi:hypothetical protein